MDQTQASSDRPADGASRPETDPAVRGDVDPLLQAAGFGDDSWIGAVRQAEAPLPGFALGRYEILEEVCRGGQGVVYKARDSRTGRRVALKRLLAGSLATASMRRRFERELEVASALDHPDIVTVFGTEIVDGVPVLAMEWVEGDRITEWAARGGVRPTRELLSVFLKVCDAVAFAHRHGVIHRDLKPSNILVDLSGEPRILDFGLAKHTQEAGGCGSASHSGEFLGTLAYAAPEQLRGGPGRADVRADVYSLGVILYELLAGAPPFEPRGGPAELLEAIERGEPRLRGGSGGSVDRDLEAITLKALSGPREARYQSADALAADVRAWLAGEPVSARVPGALARMGRAVRRHRIAFSFAGTVFLLVAGFAIVSARLAASAVAARNAQAVALEHARRETAKATAISTFLQEMLAAAHPVYAPRSDLTVREALDAASLRIDPGLGAGAEVEAAIRHVIGVTYHGLGLYDAAEPHLRRALEIRRALHQGDHADLAASLNELGHLMTSLGRYEPAEAHLREALAMYRATRGDESAEVATALNNLAKVVFMSGRSGDSEPLWREALAIRRRALGDDDLLTISSVSNLAGCLHGQGRLDEAEPLYREALARDRRLLGNDHTDVSDVLHNLAALLTDTGRHAEALAAATECLEIRRRVLPEFHPNTGIAYSRLGSACLAMGNAAEAERSYRDAIAVYEHSMPRRHPRVAAALRGLGQALAARGDLEAGEALLREALSIQLELLGEAHPETARTRDALAASPSPR
jgi:tetratricopeptide (TPR) repeat protein/tRNA A-37 threonylcarbamoyl transferase component Bud32